jgi:hypothetical protein
MSFMAYSLAGFAFGFAQGRALVWAIFYRGPGFAQGRTGECARRSMSMGGVWGSFVAGLR